MLTAKTLHCGVPAVSSPAASDAGDAYWNSTSLCALLPSSAISAANAGATINLPCQQSGERGWVGEGHVLAVRGLRAAVSPQPSDHHPPPHTPLDRFL